MNDRSLALEVRVPLLKWLPGEAFKSLCSRHHRFSGFATVKLADRDRRGRGERRRCTFDARPTQVGLGGRREGWNSMILCARRSTWAS